MERIDAIDVEGLQDGDVLEVWYDDDSYGFSEDEHFPEPCWSIGFHGANPIAVVFADAGERAERRELAVEIAKLIASRQRLAIAVEVKG